MASWVGLISQSISRVNKRRVYDSQSAKSCTIEHVATQAGQVYGHGACKNMVWIFPI